jgi:hypothetical protein
MALKNLGVFKVIPDKFIDKPQESIIMVNNAPLPPLANQHNHQTTSKCINIQSPFFKTTTTGFSWLIRPIPQCSNKRRRKNRQPTVLSKHFRGPGTQRTAQTDPRTPDAARV